MLQFLCMKFKENPHQVYFFRNSEDHLICIQRDSRISIMENVLLNLISVNMKFLTEDHLPGIIFSVVPWIKKLLMSL